MWLCQQLIIERRNSAPWVAEITAALDAGTNTDILLCSHEGSKTKFSCTWRTLLMAVNEHHHYATASH